MAKVYVKVEHLEYVNLVERCKTLEKENAKLKTELEKATTKVEKIETKKGGK